MIISYRECQVTTGHLIKVLASVIFGKGSKVPPSLYFYSIVGVKVDYCQHTTATAYKVDLNLHGMLLTSEVLAIIQSPITDNDMVILHFLK